MLKLATSLQHQIHYDYNRSTPEVRPTQPSSQLAFLTPSPSPSIPSASYVQHITLAWDTMHTQVSLSTNNLAFFPIFHALGVTFVYTEWATVFLPVFVFVGRPMSLISRWPCQDLFCPKTDRWSHQKCDKYSCPFCSISLLMMVHKRTAWKVGVQYLQACFKQWMGYTQWLFNRLLIERPWVHISPAPKVKPVLSCRRRPSVC